jgi:hypothetical protein
VTSRLMMFLEVFQRSVQSCSFYVLRAEVSLNATFGSLLNEKTKHNKVRVQCHPADGWDDKMPQSQTHSDVRIVIQNQEVREDCLIQAFFDKEPSLCHFDSTISAYRKVGHWSLSLVKYSTGFFWMLLPMFPPRSPRELSSWGSWPFPGWPGQASLPFPLGWIRC